MGSIVKGLFPQKKVNPEYYGDPYADRTKSLLASYFAGQGTDLPSYTGQLNAPKGAYNNLANSMFENAVRYANPTNFNDVLAGYREAATTGFSPDIMKYINAVSGNASRSWARDVVPAVAERSRPGAGRGSAVPEAITNAGRDFETQLAATMAPYVLQAAQGAAGNRLAGLQGTLGAISAPLDYAGRALGYAEADRGIDQAMLDRLYKEYTRTSGALLPYMLQFSGQGQGGYKTPQYTDSYAANATGSGIDTAIMLAGLFGGGGATSPTTFSSLFGEPR